VLLLLPAPLSLLLLLLLARVFLPAGPLETFLIPCFALASTGLAAGLEVSSKNDLRRWKKMGVGD